LGVSAIRENAEGRPAQSEIGNGVTELADVFDRERKRIPEGLLRSNDKAKALRQEAERVLSVQVRHRTTKRSRVTHPWTSRCKHRNRGF
jgi:hypothetical protein